MKHRGFTLLELMVALSIAALLLAIAVPSYSSSRLNSQLRVSANDLLGSIYLARSEAIKRGTTVNMCVSADGESCNSGDWTEGWMVYVMVPGEPDPVVLAEYTAPPDGFVIEEAVSLEQLTFQSTGVDSTPATFTVCRATPTVGSKERVITVDATGRASVARTETGSCP